MASAIEVVNVTDSSAYRGQSATDQQALGDWVARH